jgi:hypothetical protein
VQRVHPAAHVVGGKGISVRQTFDGSSLVEINYPLAEAMANELTLDEHCAVMDALCSKFDASGDEDLHKAFIKMFPGFEI